MRKTIWFVFVALLFSPLWPAEINDAARKAGREPLALARVANSGVMPASGGTKIAIATFVSSPDQEKLVKAMIRSIRERGGGDRESMIFVVTADAENLPCKSLTQDGVEVLPLEMEDAFLDHPLALKAFAAAQVEKRSGAMPAR